MDDLERQKAEITAPLPQTPDGILAIHPNIANLYGLRLERLTEALNDPDGARRLRRRARGRVDRTDPRHQGRRGSCGATRRGVRILGLDNAEAGRLQKAFYAIR
jgi:site-specific DNA recombinase